MKKVILVAVAGIFGILPISIASAKQAPVKRGGKEVVVHDRLAPVVAHRLVPPYLGKHVYERPSVR